MFGVKIEPVDAARAAVEPVDVIVCATNTNKVLFDGNWLREGQHITGIIGGNIQLVQGGFLTESRRELDDRAAERADLIAPICGSRSPARSRAICGFRSSGV